MKRLDPNLGGAPPPTRYSISEPSPDGENSRAKTIRRYVASSRDRSGRDCDAGVDSLFGLGSGHRHRGRDLVVIGSRALQ
jgi:hypothetical protein